MTSRDIQPSDIVAAWSRVVADCGCDDVYFCPATGMGDIECPRHCGFDVCCSAPGLHVPARDPERMNDSAGAS